MLSRKEIMKAINTRLKTKFPAIPSLSRDVKKGFSRPSFKVTLETPRESRNVNLTHREMTCRILYFPTSRYDYDEETTEMQDHLSILFGLNLTVGKYRVVIDDSDTDVVDGVLEYNFRFSFIDSGPENENHNTGELMEELEYKC